MVGYLLGVEQIEVRVGLGVIALSGENFLDDLRHARGSGLRGRSDVDGGSARGQCDLETLQEPAQDFHGGRDLEQHSLGQRQVERQERMNQIGGVGFEAARLRV